MRTPAPSTTTPAAPSAADPIAAAISSILAGKPLPESLRPPAIAVPASTSVEEEIGRILGHGPRAVDERG